MKKIVIGTMLTCLCAGPAAAGVADITVTSSGLEAKIEFVSGVAADLTISFEQVVGLYETACEVGLSASLIDPTDVTLLGRLPDAQLTSIPAAFPVLISIDPLPGEPLTFTGVVKIELHTHDLAYTANSPLRLFAADSGGAFYDITNTIGMGSYRVGGSKGGFSEFLIVADLRPMTTVIDEKFALLQATLDDNATRIDEDVLAELQAHLDAAWGWYSAGDPISAKEEVDEFGALVVKHSGPRIPETWRSAGDLVNVAGQLRQGAATLRFSLSLSVGS